jgi:DNA-binding transcriptional LysR family regulator
MARAFDHTQESLNRLPLDDRRLLSGPFWAELRVFLAVAKAKSFNKAATALAMSQPTVSRHVHRLQDAMGSQLLESSTAGVILTEKGRDLADALAALDKQLFSISHDLRAESREAEGLVRFTSTEALAGMFVVPALSAFQKHFPKMRLHIRNPINLMEYRDNQSDIVLSYAPSRMQDVETFPVGSIHLVPIVTAPYIARYGIPTRSNLESHHFIDAYYYASDNEIWRPWRSVIARGHIAALCDNSFAYGLMVKQGIGIGLLGTFTLGDPDAVPVDIDVHVRLPLFLLASRERIQARPVRAVLDWLKQVFSPDNPWLSPTLDLESLPRSELSQTFHQLYAGTPFRKAALPAIPSAE